MQGPIDDPIPVSPTGPLSGAGRRRWWQRWTERAQDDEPAGWCPSCGAEYRAGFATCSTCAVPLEAGPAPVAEEVAEHSRASSDRHDIVEYDLDDWTAAQRMEVDEQLTLSEVPHEWAGGHLHVPGAHEALVDELVDVINEADELAFPGRIDEADVEYELADWTPGQCDDLVAQLLAAEVAFGWDGVILAVREVDEATVDAIVASIDPEFPVGER